MNVYLRLCIFSFVVFIFYVVENYTSENDKVDAHNIAPQKGMPDYSFPQVQIKNLQPLAPSFHRLSPVTSEPKEAIHSFNDKIELPVKAVDFKSNEILPNENSNELKINAINELIRSNTDKSLADISLMNFNKEEFDYGWSMDYEKKISIFFHENPIFSDFSPDVIECRSENCKILISAANKDQLAKISSSVIGAVYSNNNEIIKNAMYVIDEEANTVSFYFGRNEEDGLISKVLQ